jgi:hypothetical protein
VTSVESARNFRHSPCKYNTFVTKPEELHIPGLPKEQEPPAELLEAQKALSGARVSRVGLTTTHDGDWALMVRIPKGSQWPLAEVEAGSRGFPVIYQYDPEHPPVARPAYPERKE